MKEAEPVTPCEASKPVIVVYGAGAGTTRTVCTDLNCSVHHPSRGVPIDPETEQRRRDVFTSVDWSVGSYPNAANIGSKTVVLSVGNRSTAARYAARLVALLLLAAVCSDFGRRRLPPSCVPTAFCRKPTKRQRCRYAQLQERAPPWAVLIWNRAHLAMPDYSTEPRS
jgi:hypothetical protein